MKYERIKNLRIDKDLTQAKIGEVIGVPQRTYSYYENDERSIPIEVLIKIADFHNVSVDYLLNRTNKKEINI